MAISVFPAPSNGRVAQPFSQLITSSTNWTCPAGVTRVKATIASGGTSGGPGGYLSTTVPVVPGTTYPIVVGAAGGSGGDTTAFTLRATRSGSATPDTGSAADLSIPGNVPMTASYTFPSTTNGNIANSWRGATFFNGRYYMINQGGSAWAIHTSTDGITWTNNAITGGWTYRGIASSSTHVAYFSSGDNNLYWSSNGTSFNSVAWTPDAYGFNYFGFINNLWIVGGYNKIWYSSDPTLPMASWSVATVGLNDNVASVAFGNGVWAVCKQYAGGTNVIGRRSTSLTGTWSDIDAGAPYMWGQSLVFNAGRFFLVNGPQPGYQGRCWSSTDLVTWSMNYFSGETGATSGSEIFTSPNGNGILICGYWNQNMYYWDGSTSAPINVGLRANTGALPYGNANGRTYTYQNGTTATGVYFQMSLGNPRVAGYNFTPVTASGVGGAFKYQVNTSGGGLGYLPGDGIDGWCSGTQASWGSVMRQGAVLLEWWA